MRQDFISDRAEYNENFIQDRVLTPLGITSIATSKSPRITRKPQLPAAVVQKPKVLHAEGTHLKIVMGYLHNVTVTDIVILQLGIILHISLSWGIITLHLCIIILHLSHLSHPVITI